MSEPAAADEQEESRPGPLPEPVRLRVVGLASDALEKVPAEQLPASLRRVASFQPVRRARLAATQIATALETDPDFRDRVARQVRILVPDLATALDGGQPPAAADPVEVAALAYLLRPTGWVDLVTAAQPVARTTPLRERGDTVQRLQRQLDQARGDARAAREKAREQVNDLKEQNADLRRRLAEARTLQRQNEEAADEAQTARADALAATGQVEAEARRLRARVTELEATLATTRRSSRDEREAATMRTRLLLDTVLESAQGLRRELGLPPISALPADEVAEAVRGLNGGEVGTSATEGAGRALRPDDPVLLEELLGLPRAHLIVDGYNVTKTAWPDTPLAEQRTRLTTALAAVVARQRVEVTVVFDGADLSVQPLVSPPRGVRTIFSPPGVIADEVIRELVDREPGGRPVVVVSSDREVASAVTQGGARAVQSVALIRLLART